MELSDCSNFFNISVHTSNLTMKVGEVCEKHDLLPRGSLLGSPEGQEEGTDWVPKRRTSTKKEQV